MFVMYTVTVSKYMFWRERHNNKKVLHAAESVTQRCGQQGPHS